MIEGKQEHLRGLLNHVLSQRLVESRIPIVLDMEPRWPGRKLKPQSAMIKCCENMIAITGEPHHVYADSAFNASQSILNLQGLHNSVATISINRSTNSGMAKLYSVISQELPVNWVSFLLFLSPLNFYMLSSLILTTRLVHILLDQ